MRVDGPRHSSRHWQLERMVSDKVIILRASAIRTEDQSSKAESDLLE